MSGMVSLQTIGNWNKQIGVPLADALRVSMEISGRTGEQACKRALILMAQSARAITGRAKKNRKVHTDENGKYVKNYRQGKGAAFQKLYSWMFREDNPDGSIEGSFLDAKTIGARGLAKRSWMWGLAKLGAKKTGKWIAGTFRVATIKGETVNGYLKENSLGYITSKNALPAGWESIVEMKAGNKIMAQARNKLESQYRRAMGMPRRQRGGTRVSNKTISRFFMAT